MSTTSSGPAPGSGSATLAVDALLDRRRLRRSLTRWRLLAFALAGIAAIALVLRATGAVTGSTSQIARIQISGIITEDKDQLRMLEKLAKADHVKAVLVHINSPGGTTTGGEAVFESLRAIGEKKPVVSVMGTMATSAAYIAALATDHVVARGNTVTGSVGVIFQWADVSQLLEKLGVKMNEVKSGTLKAVPSMFAPLDEQGRQLTQEMVAESQRWFVGLVSSRRKLEPGSIPGLLEGRIFSGRQALAAKLIDGLGGEREAVQWLETSRNVTKDLKIVDWKPKAVDDWSLSGALARGAGALLGGQGREIVGRLLDQGGLARLPLDGLVSVWHGPSN